MNIAIDGRMREGVGTLIRNIVLNTPRDVGDLRVLGDPSVITSWGMLPPCVEIVPFLAPIYGWREQVRFPVKRVEGCQIIHIPHFNVPARRLPCPLIVSIHDTAHLAGVLPMGPAYHLAARWYYAHAAKKARHLITGSIFSKSEILSRLRVRSEDVTVIPDGVDSATFCRKTDREIAPTLVRLGIRRPYLLVLGSIRPHKNLGGALRAFEDLKVRDSIPHQLVIVGRREGFRINIDLPRLQESVERDVVFTGFLGEQEIVALYSGADVFIFPSFYEGFGLPPLEAMSCGTPVAVSRAASIPEVVGNAGVYFDPTDPHDIASSIYNLLGDTPMRTRLSTAGRKRAAQFTWAHTAERHFAVYREFAS